MKTYKTLLLASAIVIAAPIQAFAYAKTKITIQNKLHNTCMLESLDTDYNKVVRPGSISPDFGVDKLTLKYKRANVFKEKKKDSFYAIATFKCDNEFFTIKETSTKRLIGYKKDLKVVEKSEDIVVNIDGLTVTPEVK